MRNLLAAVFFGALSMFFFGAVTPGYCQPEGKVDAKSRCVVCGMFVAKYPGWICQIKKNNGEALFFDGMKDAMAYYFHPEEFGGEAGAKITEFWAQDYYSLKWLDGRKAFFVLGSDVYGPMGHELIPFPSQEAAASFLKDHHGKEIVTFEQITPEIVNALRTGQMMK